MRQDIRWPMVINSSLIVDKINRATFAGLCWVNLTTLAIKWILLVPKGIPESKCRSQLLQKTVTKVKEWYFCEIYTCERQNISTSRSPPLSPSLFDSPAITFLISPRLSFDDTWHGLWRAFRRSAGSLQMCAACPNSFSAMVERQRDGWAALEPLTHHRVC